MPVEMLFRTLGLELEPGDVIFSRGAQKHAHSRHPEDFSLAYLNLQNIIADPLYVGQGLKNQGKIEFIGQVHAEDRPLLLIAVTIEPDRDGNYHVASAYRVANAKVQGRRERGFLRVPRQR